MDTKRAKLLLITNQFPYGRGEKSFILPELEVLKDSFDITILSLASRKSVRKTSMTTRLPSIINVEHIDIRCYNKWKMIPSLFKSFFLESLFRKEVLEVLFQIRSGRIRLLQAVCAFWLYAEAIIGWMKEHKHLIRNVDIVYSYWYHYAILAFLQYREIALNAKYKVITRAHRYDLYDFCDSGASVFKKWMDKRIDKIFFISKQGKRYYLNHYGVTDNGNKYRVSYLGSRKPNRNVSRDEDGEFFRIVSCSNVIPVKRVGLLVDAISLLARKIDNKIKWTHFGGGIEFDHVVEKARTMLDGLPSVSYSLVGAVDNDFVHNYYSTEGADVFINVSSSEGLPVSIMEAMSYGIPIIATDVGGTREAISENGILISGNPTATEVADAVYTLMSLNAGNTEKMRQNSLNRWRELFDARKNAIHFRDELLSLVR